MVKFTTEEKHLFEEIANALFHSMMRSVDRGSDSSNSPFLRESTDHPAPAAESWMSIRGQHNPSTSAVLRFQIPDLAVIDGPPPIGENCGARTSRTPSVGQNSNDKAELIVTWFDIGDKSAYFMKPDEPLPGTCDWIHEKPLFQNWLGSPKDTVLFITGPVGRGKSVLARYITKHVTDLYPSPSSIVVPFYCRAGFASFNPAAVLKHILFQIHKSFPVESARIITEFAEFGGTRGTFNSLWALFRALKRHVRFKLFAIIDGIDEIIRKEWAVEESEKLDVMKEFFTSLCKEVSMDGAEGIVKVLFISQPLAVIDQVGTEFPGKVLPIDSADITPSVGKLVEARLIVFLKERPLTTQQIDDLTDLVKEQSGSMFLYADRIINQIQKRVESHHAFQFYESLIKSYLPGNAPDTGYLDEIYGATLLEIRKGSDLSDATRMNLALSLRVLFAAEKDLEPGVLSHLVGCARVRHQYGEDTIKIPESSKIYRDAIPRAQDLVQELRNRCGNLVTVAEQSVGFSHDTVRSYLGRLDSPDLNDFYLFRNEGEGNNLMACLCVDFLMAIGRMVNGDLEQREDDPRRRSHFLAARQFVFENWSKYLRNIIREDLVRLWPAICAIFQEKTHLTFKSRENLRIPPSFFLVSNNMGNILRLARLEFNRRKISGLGKPRTLWWNKRVQSQLPELKIDLDKRDKNGNTILHHAAVYGSTELSFLLPHAVVLRNAHGSLKNKHGETPFWKALSSFNESNVWKMIKANETERESKSRERWSSFQLAADRGSAKLVAWFLDNGWSIDDDEGYYRKTALIVAIRTGNTAVVRLLLERGADIMRVDEEGCTAFHIAAETGNVDILGQLLNICSPTAQIPVTCSGEDPVFWAAKNGHFKAFEMLHLRFPNVTPNRDGRLPVHYAAMYGQMAILKSPVIAQSLDARDNFRWTPLHFAADSKSLDAVKHCIQYSDKDSRALDHGAERLMPEDQQYCQTALSIAVSSGDEEITMFLLREGASTKIMSSSGETLLHLCARSGLLEVGRHLLESRRVNPLARNKDGVLPMHLAAANGHLNVFEYLHHFCTAQAIPAYGIDLVDDDGCDALFYAIDASATSIFDFICRVTTPNFEFTNVHQETYLMAAASQTNVEFFHKVLQNTASQINNTQITGWTALHFAARTGVLDIVDALLERGANQLSEDLTGDIPLTVATGFSKVTVANRLLASESSLLHRDTCGRSILSLINESSPLWENRSVIMPWRDYNHVSDNIRVQGVRDTIQNLCAKLPKRRDGRLAFTMAMSEVLGQLTDKSVDPDRKFLAEYGATRLANGRIQFPKTCFSCKTYRAASTAHICQSCWGSKLLCHRCFVQRSTGKPIEGCAPAHIYMEILDDAWFKLKDEIINKDDVYFDYFINNLQRKYNSY